MNKPEVSRAQLERVIGRLFDEIQATKRGLASVQRAQDTKHTILAPGESIKQLGEDGRVVAEIGGDGGNAVKHVDGPTPNQPEAPEVEVQDGQFTVVVDGYDVHGEPAPADLARTIVHYSREDGFTAYQGTRKGTISGASGQKVFGVSAGTWYVRVQWESLAGKLSAPSEQVRVEIEPPVDAQDIQDTLDTAQARLDEYRDEVAAPRFQALETGLSENNDTLANARERLAEAESTLSPLPGRMEAAERNVEEARDKATEASAAAIEANNRAMTRLANGNFENNLLYWEHQNVTLTSTAHSGQQAAHIGASGWLHPASSFPVVPNQIWELSLYHQHDTTITFVSVDADDTRTTLSTHHLDGDTTWTDSGTHRVTIPTGVDMLSFTITGDNALVDDITLRDVTDVVRLEEAANANRQKAEQAISELAVMRLAVDGEGGLKDRLASAETTLETKADQSELPALETRLSDAFGADIATALGTAAADATSKANAAQAAAEAKADELAKAEAKAAQSAAEATAAVDAAAKAQKAHDDAVATASDDATSKANAAKTAAENAAAADAKAKADAAQAEAIRQAALDATAKADAAKTAAENAAKDYADQQDATVKAEAAADAQTKADAVREVAEAAQAEAESKASPEWVLSRGTDLVTNGSGYLGDNTNFSSFTYDPTDAPTGARGSFVIASDSRPSGPMTDEMLPIDPRNSYLLSVMAREQGLNVEGDSTFYTGLAPYDAQGHMIGPQSYSHDPLSMTTLTAPLNPGDRTIEVESAANFGRLSAASYVGVWNWVDPNGRTWEAGTYTRDYPRFDSVDGNVIHLTTAYTGQPRPVGTPVSNNRAGGTYMYAVSNKQATAEWERVAVVFGGVHDTSSGNAVRSFPPATAAVKVMFLPNYRGASGSRQAFAAVSFSDATAALAEAETARAEAKAAQAKADAAQAEAEEAHEAAGTAWTHADAALTRAGTAETNAITEAGRLATAAREAAEAEADRLAKAEAQAAQSAAEQTAAADAKAKADQALKDAKADATAKADAAKAAAESTASGDATTKANAAKAAAEAEAARLAGLAEEAAKTAAATDAKAKADAAQAEAIRQAALDATAKANAAKTAAENAAKQHADNMPKMMGGTTAPSGTAPNGSVWFRRDSSNTVIGRWERIGNAWVQQEVSGELIDNLEAGKITALYTEFAESVVGKMWAQLGVFDRLEARSGWVGGTMLEDGAVTAEKITASREMITRIMGAEWAYISERLVVDGDLIANNADIISAAIKNLSVTERADLFEAFITTLGAQEAVIDLLIGTEAWIGGTMLKDDTVTTQHIEFTETLVGNIAELLHLVVDQIDANQLWADQTWQNEAHFGSEDADQSSRIDATQLRFTKHNHETETSTDIVRLGGEGIGLTFADADTGETTGSLSPEGNAALQNVDTEHLTVDGRPLTTPESTQYVHPSGDQSLLSWMPRGVIARGSRLLEGGTTNYRQYGVLEVAATLHAGRSYWITVPPFTVRDGVQATNFTVLSYTTDGTPPDWNSPIIARERRTIAGYGDDVEHSAHALFTPTVTAHHRILLSVYGADGIRRYSEMMVHMVIEDAGKAVPDGSVVRETYWDHPSGSSPILGAIRSNNTITTEWALDWYQNYSHGGTRKASHGTASGGNSGGYGSGALTQGARPNRLSSEGIYHSLFGFAGATHSSDPAELGKTIQTALAGVDIQSILLVARSHTAHSTSNRTDYGIEATPYGTPPNQYTDAHWWVGTYGTSPGHHIHASIPVNEYGPLLKSGDIQAFGLRTSSTNLRQAGMLYATIGDTPPRLIISYTKEQDGS